IDAFEPHPPWVDQFSSSAFDQFGFQPVHQGDENVSPHAEPDHIFSGATENIFIGQEHLQKFKNLGEGLAAKEDLHVVVSALSGPRGQLEPSCIQRVDYSS